MAEAVAPQPAEIVVPSPPTALETPMMDLIQLSPKLLTSPAIERVKTESAQFDELFVVAD